MKKSEKFLYRKIKSILDFILSFITIIIYLPISIIIALLVYLETKQFPFIIQQRGLSLHSKKIKILKFRTFIKNNNEQPTKPLNREHLSQNIGPFGKFLRLTGIDEFPQFLNVLVGQMSIIGPRPLDLEDLKLLELHYPEISKERSKLISKPGITGLWQTHKDPELNPIHLINLDQFYEKEASFLLDLYILLKTLSVVFLFRHRDGILGVNGKKIFIIKYSMILFNTIYFVFICLFLIFVLI